MTSDVSSGICQQLSQAAVPGRSIAIVDESGVQWAQGFGLADLRSEMPATPDTVYHLFSGTKLFTAVATLQLAARNMVGNVREFAKLAMNAMRTPRTMIVAHPICEALVGAGAAPLTRWRFGWP
jgi:hypothetical protein